MHQDGDVVKCTYAENDTDPVVRIFATSPERDEVEFSVEGLDAGSTSPSTMGVC